MRAAIAAEERPQRVWLSDDFCIVDDDKFFQYGSLEIPIIGHKEPFIWGVWTELAEKDFALAEDLVGVEGRENEQPFLGTLASDIPIYPPCIGIPVRVRMEPAGIRPTIHVLTPQHPLYAEQNSGVTPARVREFIEWHQRLRSNPLRK